ncbi:MAG: sulfide/dihydroorotate dehydrogenase-like FAD/NAD-binding protein [Candidatus Aminicenantes bacterium]|nr:sulfide/dihydroorotate dehydrogenase-like FAD/NAD-binding protein [Candidatus Aminicenantes bacterium]
MTKIIRKEILSENVAKFIIESETIAENRKAGQFVIIKIGEKGERIPLTIADADKSKGTITLVVQKVGTSSHKLFNMKVGESLTDLVGPLGRATEVEKVGTVVAAGGGVGIAPMYPIARAFKEAGNKLIAVLAARSKDLIILEEEFRDFADEMILMTDDGSYGKKGLVTEGIEAVIKREKVDIVVTIGPAVMMKFVALLTQKYNIHTLASLNTIMVDGTGMCGACRVSVGGKTRFVCVDGPEFDAHKVDFDGMLKRMNAYKREEEISYQRYLESLT